MNIQAVDIHSLPVMTHQGMPVATTEMLATLYGAENRALRDNFRNNKGRFVEGKHYFTLEGDDLRGFRSRDENIVSRFCPVSNARVVNLWTERGAARHAKLLNTDAAWDVFEALEDAYFRAREESCATNNGAQAIAPRGTVTPAELDELMVAIPVREYLRLVGQQPGAVAAEGRNATCWTQDEDQRLLAGIASGQRPAEIARVIGRSVNGIIHRRKLLRRKAKESA